MTAHFSPTEFGPLGGPITAERLRRLHAAEAMLELLTARLRLDAGRGTLRLELSPDDLDDLIDRADRAAMTA